jgi:hypothetical protein
VDERARRLARNEATYRAVNEQIEQAASRLAASVAEAFEFFCECGDLECSERIVMSIAEYEVVRSEPTHFCVRPGHVRLEVERVVEAGGDYLVVEKIGAAADEAARLDPRGDA